ncbi:hypothetical protein [Microvirga pudoricolor]|uniref:hypothetical protein n=1 Tax=Microvirga pudoricolor TaxID=2778729 RepID=UPI00194F3437|nr:hypothetical protein [Microvirga pudoricolor]MBM6592660.1 hypothetical protein [Microvirga pudoricolor]
MDPTFGSDALVGPYRTKIQGVFMRVDGKRAVTGLGLVGLLALGGCGGGAPGEEGSTLSNMVLFAGPTVPPPMTRQTEDVYCPRVQIPDGGAAIQAYSGGRVGDASGLRSQISLGELARECTGNADGTTSVKVGVEVLALLGAGGGAGRYDAPVNIVVKRGDQVIASRPRRVAIAIPSGETQGRATIVEENIVVSAADATNFSIDVGLGAGARSSRR